MSLEPLTKGSRVIASASNMRTGERVGAAILTCVVLFILVAPLVLPHPSHINPRLVFDGPSSAHLLGTDDLGRDLAARFAQGGRLSIGLSLAGSAIAVALGVFWGGVAAVNEGSWWGTLMLRLADVAMAVPAILTALVFVAAFGAKTATLAVIGGVLLAPVTSRVIRSALLVEMSMDYFTAARTCGLGRTRALVTEALPNILSVVISQAILNVAWMVGLEAALSFLGVGIQPPEASWGTLMREGYDHMYDSVVYATMPIAFVFTVILGLNLVAGGLQRAVLVEGRS